MTSGTNSRESKGRGRPRVDATPIGLRFPPDLLAILDAYIARERPGVSRPEALRYIFREWAIAHDHMPADGFGMALELEDLNAENDG
ncbi:hypothetical protein [Phreatobacter stygius]|uniref:Ribbon-helix-helix protein, CopG family n=1 Tax=Phreatobacter stygius TaxID=1940610 RepID=A0A4D7BBZ4_9HYPH|nr:hypothetical protein [Phreatobacter stygius]QCI68163.1 hypothetical protein E8M01_30395 [Phreatobacter stygius]